MFPLRSDTAEVRALRIPIRSGASNEITQRAGPEELEGVSDIGNTGTAVVVE